METDGIDINLLDEYVKKDIGSAFGTEGDSEPLG